MFCNRWEQLRQHHTWRWLDSLIFGNSVGG
jgi:hypothetical protein